MAEANTNPRAEQEKAQRRRRQDMGPGASFQLSVPAHLKKPGYEYRWINDDGRRIHAKTVQDDWDIVKDKAIPGSGEGTPVMRRVGKQEDGSALNAYLCEKKSEFYEEDKARTIKAIAEREDAIRRGAPATSQGLSGPTAYIPDRIDGFSSANQGQNRIGGGEYKP